MRCKHRLLAALTLLLTACGYRTLGPRGQLGVTSLCIMPFAETGPAGLTGELTAALAQALAAEGFTIEPDANRADSVLTGHIELRQVPGATLQAVQLYTVDVTVSAALWGEGKEPLWQETVSLQEDFLPTAAATDTEPLVTERRRRVALSRLMERAADALAQSVGLSATRSVATQAPPAEAQAAP